MNRWDNLPIELQNYIKAIVAAQMIESIWRGQHYRKRYVLNIAKKYTDKEWNSSGVCPRWDCTDPITAIEIEYCVNYVLLCKNTKIWENFIQMIQQRLWENRYTEVSRTQLYHRTEKAREKLQQRIEVTHCGGPHWATYWSPPRYWDVNGTLCDNEGIVWDAPGSYRPYLHPWC